MPWAKEPGYAFVKAWGEGQTSVVGFAPTFTPRQKGLSCWCRASTAVTPWPTPTGSKFRVRTPKALGPEHPDVAQSLENYAALLRKTGRATEAAKMEARAKAIRAKRAEQNPAN